MKVHIVQGQFGQDAIRKILIDLGGKATAKTIAAEAMRLYPESKLCDVVSIRLNHMRNWHEVEQTYDKKEKQWYWRIKTPA